MGTKECNNKSYGLEIDQNTHQTLQIHIREMNAVLLSLKKAGETVSKFLLLLLSSNEITPQMYGLPKIHKPDVPFKTYCIILLITYLRTPKIFKPSPFAIG